MLYDQFGREIKLDELTQERGQPSLASIRNVWFEVVADGLTPGRLARILQDAVHSNARAYLTLAEEMEERELHYSAQLRTRKLAVSGLEAHIKAASEDPKDVAIAEELQDLVDAPEFGTVIAELLDGLGKGYSVVEIIWDRTGKKWRPKQYKWRDPRFFRFDIETGEELRLLDEKDPVFGIALDPFKWIVHRPRLKTGLPIRGGLARLAAASYMIKSFNLKDWLAFAEVYGMPLRVGKYSPKATEDDIRTLINAVANLGTDAAAVIPDSMRIDFESAVAAAGGGELFKGLAEYVDSQVSKAVLGQTMTADNGSSRAQATVHNEVRLDVRKDDIKQVVTTIGRDFIRAYVDLNYGPRPKYPSLVLPVEEPEDLEKFSRALVPLIDRGLKVPAGQVREKFGLPPPGDDDEVLGPRKVAPAAPSEEPEEDDEPPQQPPARNREEPQKNRDEIDDLRDDALADWQPQIDPVLNPVSRALAASNSFDEFKGRLAELEAQMDTTAFQQALATALFESHALGDAED